MYFAIVILVISAALFIGAVEGLRSKRRYAWRMVLAGLVFDFLNGITQYYIYGHSVSDVFKSVAATLVLLYLLGQVHEHFNKVRGGHTVEHHPQHMHAAHHATHPAHHNPHVRVG